MVKKNKNKKPLGLLIALRVDVARPVGTTPSSAARDKNLARVAYM